MIREEIGVTEKQFDWLLHEGGRLPSGESVMAYKRWLLKDIVEVRKTATETAAHLGTVGGEAVRLRVDCAVAANSLVKGILAHMGYQVQAMSEASIASGQVFPLDAVMPSKAVVDALKALKPFCDLGPVAEAFKSIYGDAASIRALYPEQDGPGQDKGIGRPFANIDGSADGGSSFMSPAQLAEMANIVANFSPAEAESYADGGDEPPPGAHD
jgi:hypothetical protein